MADENKASTPPPASVKLPAVKETLKQKMRKTQVWRSIFRHDYKDTPKNRTLSVVNNVFLHLHPVKVMRGAVKFKHTWCMGGLSFFLFLILKGDSKSSHLR